ncbi:hypothetical protein AnigIFM63309_000398 [Aspergillus niger]|nr:hypothetical protein AnigIFM63309_000398 [Aspergillus niger]
MSAEPLISAPIFEHRTDGFGIENTRPRLSWRFSYPENVQPLKDWAQTAYEIETIVEGEQCQRYLVSSTQSVLVPWPGASLRTGVPVSVRVRCYSKGRSTPTEWSSSAVVECTLLSRNDWHAVPIATMKKFELNENAPLRPVRFRRSFALPLDRKVLKARLYTTAHGVYEAFINGVRVGDHVLAPGWTSYHHRLGFQTYDVTSLVSPGGNCIAAEVAEGWFAGRMGIRGGKPCNYGTEVSLLAQLEMVLDTGEKVTVVSGKDWKCHPSAIQTSEIYNGEVCDMRLENWNWNTIAIDDNSWDAVKEVAFPSAKIFSPDHPPIRVMEEVYATAIITTPSGKLIFDFGQNLVGLPCIHRLPPNCHITLRHAEVLENGELGVRPLRGARCTDVLITGGYKVVNWMPKYTFHGFRYMQIDGWEHAPLALRDITAKVIHTDMHRRGWFKCSNPLLNKLHQNIVWSMKGNFLSVPTDCPQRDERLGWTGDIQVFGPTANFLYNTISLLGNWLEDLNAEQLADPNKIPPLVVPDVLGKLWRSTPQAIWHDVVIILPWDLFQSSGDCEILRRQYLGMVSWLRSGVQRGNDSLWDSKVWQLGDWVDPAAPPGDPGNGRTDGILAADAYLVHVTSLMGSISKVLGLAQEADLFASEAAKLKETFQNKYITPVGNLANYTQAAIALAVQFDLYKTRAQLATAGRSLARLAHAAKFHVSTGFAGTPHILPALVKTEQPTLAYRMLMEKHCPSWLYPITMGATTVWERWDALLPDGQLNPGQMLSFNHYAFGAVGHWLHSTIGGLHSTDGWKTVLVRPIPGGGLTSAEVMFESPYGQVVCSWSVEATTFHLKVVIPPNTTAKVIFPDSPMDNPVVRIVGSGLHTWSIPYDVPNWPPAPLPGACSPIGEPPCDCPK